MSTLPLRDTLSDAIRYWEPRRIAYNAVLAAIVLFFFFTGWPGSKDRINVAIGLGIFILAVLANVAYCAAYPVDVFAQLSGVRAAWLKIRWLLFAIGLAFAAVITRYIAQGMFGGGI